jgi:hypothetical protein
MLDLSVVAQAHRGAEVYVQHQLGVTGRLTWVQATMPELMHLGSN